MGQYFDAIADSITDAIRDQLPDATVLRNEAYPERIPSGGYVCVLDGDPGSPEMLLGGFSNAYYNHRMEIAVGAQAVDRAERDELFSSLLAGIGAALEDDLTVGGLCVVVTYDAPVPEIITPEGGGAAVKAGVVNVNLEYETPSPLA